MAHLDDHHKKHLLLELEKINSQAWLTGVSKELFSDINNQTVFFELKNQNHSEVFKAIPKKRIQDRNIRLVRFDSSEEAEFSRCQLLFVNKEAESKELFEQLEKLNRIQQKQLFYVLVDMEMFITCLQMGRVQMLQLHGDVTKKVH